MPAMRSSGEAGPWRSAARWAEAVPAAAAAEPRCKSCGAAVQSSKLAAGANCTLRSARLVATARVVRQLHDLAAMRSEEFGKGLAQDQPRRRRETGMCSFGTRFESRTRAPFGRGREAQDWTHHSLPNRFPSRLCWPILASNSSRHSLQAGQRGGGKTRCFIGL